jgi:hypothetical protein
MAFFRAQNGSLLWQGQNAIISQVRYAILRTGAINGNSCSNSPGIDGGGASDSMNQKRRRKYFLINYERLRELAGFDSYQDLQINHKRWVEASLLNQANGRDAKWTRSLAVGSRHFIDTIRKKMGLAAKWRKQLEDEDSFMLRERSLPYGDDFEAKKSDIGHQNTYSWN